MLKAGPLNYPSPLLSLKSGPFAPAMHVRWVFRLRRDEGAVGFQPAMKCQDLPKDLHFLGK